MTNHEVQPPHDPEVLRAALEYEDCSNQDEPFEAAHWFEWDLPTEVLQRAYWKGTAEEWQAWWGEQVADARRRAPGIGDMWVSLLTEEQEDPITVTASLNTGLEIADGLHRTAAAVLSSRPFIRARVGLYDGIQLHELLAGAFDREPASPAP